VNELNAFPEIFSAVSHMWLIHSISQSVNQSANQSINTRLKVGLPSKKYDVNLKMDGMLCVLRCARGWGYDSQSLPFLFLSKQEPLI
jgi:hypothetical protein